MQESEPNQEKMVIGDWLIPMLVISAGLVMLYIARDENNYISAMGVTVVLGGLMGLGINLRKPKTPA